MSMPHENSQVYSAGATLDEASAALILLHGRGASARDIISLSTFLTQPGLAFLAPQADDSTWYPNRFISPLEQNEPHLTSALNLVDKIVQQIAAAGISTEKVFMGGFSQGACLASEYVIRNPKKYGGLMVFSGGYIGPLDIQRQPNGDLNGMPAFLGCSDIDAHVPLQRVKETTALLQAMGAQVTEKIYPDMGHTIIHDEIKLAQALISNSL